MQVKDEKGWSSLFAGYKVAAVGSILSSGIYFALYAAFRQIAVVSGTRVSGVALCCTVALHCAVLPCIMLRCAVQCALAARVARQVC